jgi:glycosyltransferase involved in cell wall biosynthesis
LDFAIRILSDTIAEIDLDIFGPIDDVKYWATCRRLIDSLPPNVRAEYRGELQHSEVGPTLSRYDLMILPTLGENHGHVILEALAAGCPVMISEHTPWRRIVEAGAGWVLPLDDPNSWIETINGVAHDDAATAIHRREAAIVFAREILDDGGARLELCNLFKDALSTRGRRRVSPSP